MTDRDSTIVDEDEVSGNDILEQPIDPIDRLTSEESDDLVDAESTVTAITYSGQDFDAIGLVRRIGEDGILIPTFGHGDERITSAGFQRSFVWSRPQMDRFVESLLLGYPVPGIFLVRQGDRRYLVLDGQQRLRTLQLFVDGIYEGKEFSLQNVSDRFKGLTYKSLPEELRRLFDDTFIPATIVGTDGTIESLEAIYQIFERLNSGGTQLTPHEIRIALFAGPFIDFLEELNATGDWRFLYGKRSPRLRDQELILRILGLFTMSSNYKRPLKSFLNGVVAANRDMSTVDSVKLRSLFMQSSRLIRNSSGREALRWKSSQINVALTEAVFVGLMKRLDGEMNITEDEVAAAIQEIRENPRTEVAISRATADEESVKTRLEVAISRFAEA
ncbi:MAG: DUF262 domain-containing protein [Acidobacteria bacterium]|nr:DUF262 domain-containing protein [Acidobacteriota bacterium]